MTYNSAEDLRTLFGSSGFAQAFRRVVVVDNASQDDSVELAQAAGCMVFPLARNVGFGAAANIGAAATSSDIFAVLNPDIDVRSASTVQRLARHFEDPRVGVVAPALRLPSGALQDSARDVPQPIDLVRRRLQGTDIGRIDATQPTDVPWAVGACLLIRRESFNDVGGFDHRYPLYFEDVDLCVRLAERDWRVRFDPEIEIDHVHRAASRKSLRSPATQKHIASAARFYLRNRRYLVPSRGRTAAPAAEGPVAAPASVRPRVHLAASPGGHIQLLKSVSQAFDDHDRTWLTAAGAHADELRALGERVIELPRVKGVPRTEVARNVRRSIGTALRERPDLVVTSGADLVVPFCLASRALGARLVFAETMARVTTRSRSARILEPLSERQFVQWPEQQSTDRTVHVWPAYLEELPEGAPAPGRGTMVTLGTHTDPFDRLIGMVEEAVAAGILPGPAGAQLGYTTLKEGSPIEGREWYAPQGIAMALRDAEIVVTHAGAGAIFAALAVGKRPIVVARRHALREHTDDHQLELAHKLSELGLIVTVESEITPDDVARARMPFTGVDRPHYVNSLVEELRSLLQPDSGETRRTAETRRAA